jgi:hypothetical protein
MVLKARPGVRRQWLGCRDTVGTEIWKGGIVGLAVVHEYLGLAANAEMFLCALGGVGHRDEGDVGVGQGFGGFAGGSLVSPLSVAVGCFKDLQVRPHVDISSWDLRRANKYVTTVAARAIDTDGVLASMCGRAVERDFASLTAVLCVGWPGSLIPAILKPLGNLGDSEGRDGQSEESGLGEHFYY